MSTASVEWMERYRTMHILAHGADVRALCGADVTGDADLRITDAQPTVCPACVALLDGEATP